MLTHDDNTLYLYNTLQFSVFIQLCHFRTLLNRCCWLHFTHEKTEAHRSYIIGLQSQDSNSCVLAPSSTSCHSPSPPGQTPNMQHTAEVTLQPAPPPISPPDPTGLHINATEGQKYKNIGAEVWGNKVQEQTSLTFSESVQTWMALGMRRAVFSLVMEQMSFKRTVSWHPHRDREWTTSKKRH